jgi:hypothetical protein
VAQVLAQGADPNARVGLYTTYKKGLLPTLRYYLTGESADAHVPLLAVVDDAEVAAMLARAGGHG